MFRSIRWTSVVLVVVMFAGCGINPPKPVEQPLASQPPVDNSFIAIPVVLKSSIVSSQINANLSTEEGDRGIYMGRGLPTGVHGATAQVGVHRSGAASVSSSGGNLSWSVPVAINNGRIDYKLKVKLGPFKVGEAKHALTFGGSGKVGGVTRIAVDDAWNVRANTELDFAWQEKLWVDLNPPIGHISINVSGLANDKLKDKLKEIAPKIDQAIAAIKAREIVENAWRTLHEPIAISADPPLWLTVDPLHIGIGPTRTEGGDILLQPSIAGKMRLVLGQKPTRPSPVPALPSNRGQSSGDEISMSVRADVPFVDLNSAAATQLVGKEFDAGGAKVKIKAVSIAPHGRGLVVRVDFDARNIPGKIFSTADGWIYLTGVVSFDDKRREISVREFDYDLETRQYLLKVADWLLHGQFVESIQSRLTFDVSKHVDPVRAKVDKGLRGHELAKGIELDLVTKEVAVSDLYVSKDAVSIFAKVRGNARVSVNALP